MNSSATVSLSLSLFEENEGIVNVFLKHCVEQGEKKNYVNAERCVMCYVYLHLFSDIDFIFREQLFEKNLVSRDTVIYSALKWAEFSSTFLRAKPQNKSPWQNNNSTHWIRCWPSQMYGAISPSVRTFDTWPKCVQPQ